MLDPMRRSTDHLAEKQPIRVGAPVPIQQIVGFVPQFDIAELVAISRQYMIDEVSVVLQSPRRSRCATGAREGRRRVMDTWQQVEGAAKGRNKPIIPRLATRRMIFGPRKMRANVGCPYIVHAGDCCAYTVIFTKAQPLGEAKLL